MKIIARKNELKILKFFLDSEKAEFMAVYGRRRVGKTFLIRNFFSSNPCKFFSVTGVEKGSYLRQRENFSKRISEVFFNNIPLATPKNWYAVFAVLRMAIDELPKEEKVVLFFDEFPWLATPRSQLLEVLEYYWNEYWGNDSRIKIIVCGSLASWIIKNIINNTGGLYQRVTRRLKIEPFTLYETKLFLESKNILLTNKHITLLYMVLGGIPLYLDQVPKGLSAEQTIDNICFHKNGLLFDELQELFKSLFKDASTYIRIIKELSRYRHGLSKEDLANKLKLSRSGRLSSRLQELEDAGFVISFVPYPNKERGKFFKIVDEYTLFYFNWIAPNLSSIKSLKKPANFWSDKNGTGEFHAWRGYAFESICYKHETQIREKLNLTSSSATHSWRGSSSKKTERAQIDLLFDRNDNAITLCEIKYSDKPFSIDSEYSKNLEKKKRVFIEDTKIDKQIFIAMITSAGIKESQYSKIIDNCVTLDDLFQE